MNASSDHDHAVVPLEPLEDASSSHSHAHAAAAAAAAHVAATSTTAASTNTPTATATPAQLLRDWRPEDNPPPAAAAQASAAQDDDEGGIVPPLAPSVLIQGDHRASRVYPVARVAALVRGAVDAVADHIHDHMHIATTTSAAAATATTATRPDAAVECLSVRSEGAATAAAAVLPHNYIAVDSVRSVPAMERGDDLLEEQFVLIDGDLVALPVIPPNGEERDGLEDFSRNQLKACQPFQQQKVRKGVRGVRKWIKRKLVSRKDKQNKEDKDKTSFSTRKSRKDQQQQQQEESTFVDPSPNVSQCESIVNETNPELRDALAPPVVSSSTASATAAVTKRSPRNRNKSPLRGGWKTKRDKKDKEAFKEDHKKKRRSWRNLNPKKIQWEEQQEQQQVGSTTDTIPEHQPSVLAPASAASVTTPASATLEPTQPTAGVAAAASASYPPAAAASYPPAAAATAMPQQIQHDPNQLHPHLSLIHQQQLQQQAASAAAAQPPQQPQLQRRNDQLHAAAAASSAYAQEDILDPLAPPAAAYAYDPLLAPAAPAYAYDSLAQPPPMPGPPTHQDSVHASFVGNVDQVMASGVQLDAAACVEASYIESASYWPDEKKDEPSISVLPPDADYKVDKADAPDVEYMLRRAEQETVNDVLEREGDEDPWMEQQQRRTNNKTTGMSCPLSTAKVTDELVHNDVLKVVMVGAQGCEKSALARAIRQSNKKPKRRTTLGVDVHSWNPDVGQGQEPVKFSIWDVQGASQQHSDANFGANPGIQSLFFSSNALYLLVWDLAANNPATYSGRQLLLDQVEREDDSDEEEEDEEDNQFVFEEAKRQADLALQADIEKRVLSWIDRISRSGPGSSILPVAVIPEHMSTKEANRRCDILKNLLEIHIRRFENDPSTPKLLIGMDNIMCVSLANNSGIHELQETLIAIAADDSVFEHLSQPVSNATVKVLDTVRRLKQDHKLVRVDHLMAELGKHILTYDEITDALHFLSSIGELLYFGNNHDELLSRYLILSRKWFVSALSCILRNDLKRELSETRRFMNMQCIYSNHQFPECPVIQSLTGGSASTCPLLSSTDTNMLWLSMQFMREAADRSSQLSESSTTSSTMFGFLERLLVQSGIFLPLNVSRSMDDAEVYFVPSLMATATDNNDVWTFKSSEGWMTTLCHSWLFRDGAPSDLMEHITVGLVRDLHEFSRTFSSVDVPNPPHRSQSFPLVRSGASDFLRAHDSDAIGRIKIHQIMCWQSSFLVKIGRIFADPDGELKESFVEVFVTLVDQSSPHCVASDAMRATMQRLVVSGKGQAGSHGAKLWKGGFEVVLRSIQSTLGDFSNIDRQVVCPECLSHSQPRFASTWSWDSVKAAAESGSSIVRCIRGHRVDSNLICGTAKRQETSVVHEQSFRAVKAVSELLHSVVLVGLWDTENKEIRNVGSGFIADRRLGLIVTAGHVLFNMEEGASFGSAYFGIKNAKVVVGVIPEGGHNAVYRYFGEIIAEDISGMDACVVRLTAKIIGDIDGDLTQQPDDALASSQLNLEAILQEGLRALKLTTRFELEESVRILGFNQGGEGLLEKGKHVNRSADFAKGYICKKFVAPPMSDDDSSHCSEMSSKSMCFVPREEVVVICPTIAGHSGGPCVNNDGKVVGVLSRADPGERQRCYLVPSSELKDLIKKARKVFTRPSVGLGL